MVSNDPPITIGFVFIEVRKNRISSQGKKMNRK